MGGLSLVGFAILAVAGWGLWIHYHNLPEEVIVAQMRQCADKRDRSAVLEELNGLGYECVPVDGPYPGPYGRVTADLVARSVSYVEVSCSNVRADFFGGKGIGVIFLFDAQQHLVTWSYDVSEYSL